jgi:integrase
MKVRQARPRDTGSVVVRKRKDGSDSYMLKWRTVTKTVTAASRKEAFALLPVFVAEAKAGLVEAERLKARKRAEQPTLAEWVEVFLAQHVSQDPDRLATRTAYRNVLRLYVLPTLGRHRLHEVTSAMIRETLQEQFAKGRSINTIRLACAVLHRLFDAAFEDGYPITNPTPKFSKLKLGEDDNPAERAQKAALTAPEVAALLSACDEPDLKLFAAVLVGCGLRRGECIGLRWRDVDLKAGVLHIRGAAKAVNPGQGESKRVWLGKTKTRSSTRDVAIGPALVALFTAERARQEIAQGQLRGRDSSVRELKSLLPLDACVFPVSPDPADLTQPTDPDAMGRRFKRAAARAGLKTRPHALRHTSISHAIEGGLSLADAAARAGHGSVLTTARTYVHSVSESQRKAALIGDSLLAPAQPPAPEQLPNSGTQT